VCEVTLHVNLPSPELALEIAPLIHSGRMGLSWQTGSRFFRYAWPWLFPSSSLDNNV
jgi:hypothetical protein